MNKSKALAAAAICLSTGGCVDYEAEPFDGNVLPRVTGYTTGVTDDWLYINLATGRTYNASGPNAEIREGEQLSNGAVSMDWDIAFCGYRLRTNSGTSGPGMGGAADLGYGNYSAWNTRSQVEGMDYTADTDDISITMSQKDWIHYCVVNNLDIESNPWFDPNSGIAQTTTSANGVLSGAITFAAPPPVYTPSMHTYAVRSSDGRRYYKLQIVSWFDPATDIGGEGGRICYYLDELK